MNENFSLETSMLAELQKDVKLKGGGIAVDEEGKPMKPLDAIAKSIANNAMKGDIAAVNFIRNLTKKSDPEAQKQRELEAKVKLDEKIQLIVSELEHDGLWLGQQIEVEQLAQNLVIIDNLNQQMTEDGYADVLTEYKKDGSATTRINPLHEWRDKYQKKFMDDWDKFRIDAQRRRIMQQQNSKRK